MQFWLHLRRGKSSIVFNKRNFFSFGLLSLDITLSSNIGAKVKMHATFIHNLYPSKSMALLLKRPYHKASILMG